jgi:hypothetical protein
MISSTDFQDVAAFSNPFCFLGARNEADNNQKQNTVTLQCGAKASSSLKRNK